MVPFSSTGASTPPSFLFKVVGLFRMGFNEYDTRLAYVSLADARKIANARGSVFGVEIRFADPMNQTNQNKEIAHRYVPPFRVIDRKEITHDFVTDLSLHKVIV